MNKRKEKIQESIILLILFIVIGVVFYVTQKIFSKKLPPNILNLLLLVTVGLLVLDLIIYFIWGKDKRVEKEITSYPPHEMDSFLIGYLNCGETVSNHFSSLVISLAVKGFIKIEKLEDGTILLTKLKDLDNSLSKYERLMYKVLFKGNRDKVTTEEISSGDGRYFRKMETVVANEFLSDKNIETKMSRKLRRYTSFAFAALVAATMIIYSRFAYDTASARVVFTILLITLAGFMYALLSYLIVAFQTGKETSVKYGALIASIFILCGNIVFPYFIIHFSNVGIMFMCQLNLLLLCVIVNGFIFKRSDYLNSVLGKVMGFRYTIEQFDKEGISKLYQRDNDYFYDMLPYIYSLDLSIVLFDGNDDKFDIPYFYNTWENKKSISFNDFNGDIDILDNAILNSY